MDLAYLQKFLKPARQGMDLVSLIDGYREDGMVDDLFHDLKQWMASSSRIFWPKCYFRESEEERLSIFLAKVVEAAFHHENNQVVKLGYYFFNKLDPDRSSPISVISTIAFRLACVLPMFRDELMKIYNDKFEKNLVECLLQVDKNSKEDVELLFQFLLEYPFKQIEADLNEDVFVLINGLDEEIWFFLFPMFLTLPSRVRFVLTTPFNFFLV